MSDKPRIGLLGIMQELYDEMIPGITEHQADFAPGGRPAPRCRGPDVTFHPPSPQPARTSRRSPPELVAAGVDGVHDRHAHLRAGHADDPGDDASCPFRCCWPTSSPNGRSPPAWNMDNLTYNQGIHGAQDQANALVRADVPFSVITGDWRSDGFRGFGWLTGPVPLGGLHAAPVSGCPDRVSDERDGGHYAMTLRRCCASWGRRSSAEDLGSVYARLPGRLRCRRRGARCRAGRALRSGSPAHHASVTSTRRA